MEQGCVWWPCNCQAAFGDKGTTGIELRWRVGPRLIVHKRALRKSRELGCMHEHPKREEKEEQGLARGGDVLYAD
jgi:hypothetical protein